MEEKRIIWQADNLPKTSKLWVRQVKKLLDKALKGIEKLTSDTARTLKALNSNLGTLTRNARVTEENVENLQQEIELTKLNATREVFTYYPHTEIVVGTKTYVETIELLDPYIYEGTMTLTITNMTSVYKQYVQNPDPIGRTNISMRVKIDSSSSYLVEPKEIYVAKPNNSRAESSTFEFIIGLDYIYPREAEITVTVSVYEKIGIMYQTGTITLRNNARLRTTPYIPPA